ncbi:MAG: hypothetical protein BAA02_11860 [Paenibacillaceae bacterium ZCTH02-B3]|nr:MAG: hypothetical protein BAA02_11860 [Paenibacillaceae bacterium ZCTH02-B3]
MSFSITGIASGMDTAQMIELMMKLERLPYENLQARKQELSQEQSVIRSINTKLVTLRNAVADLMYNVSFRQVSAKTSDNTVATVSASEGAATGSYQIQVTHLAKKHAVASSEFVKDALATGLEGEITLYWKDNPDGKTITLEGSTYEEVLSNLRDAINDLKAGVRASLIETKPGHVTLVLTAEGYGEEAGMKLGTVPDDRYTAFDDGDSLAVLTALGLVSGGSLNTIEEGQNAKVKVNGLDIEAAGNTLVNVLPGLTVNLLKPGEVTITVDTDADKIADKVQKFVDAYNDVINTIRNNTAKGAILQGDFTLLSLSSNLYDLFNGAVGGGGNFRFLFEIGLEIDKGVTSGSGMTGTISFNRDKFKEAFAANPDAVKHLFTHDDPGSFARDGVAVRFYNEIINWTRTGSGYLTSKIAGYDSTIKQITEQMERMDLRLQNRQKQLEAQFAAMENALAQLRNQQIWMAAQIASLTTAAGN